MPANITRGGIEIVPGAHGLASAAPFRLVRLAEDDLAQAGGETAAGFLAAELDGTTLLAEPDLAPCILEPGVYAIVDAKTQKVVGILIVYPDCKTEIIPAAENFV